MATEGRALGIDIGGTGIKAAVVDLSNGSLASDRIREKTPQPATPDAVVEVAARVCQRLVDGGWLTPDLKAGAGFPAVIKDGRALTAANVDPAFIDFPVQRLLSERLGRPVVVINDADAAGLAEVAYGAGRGHPGVVLLLTIGTGIGSGLLIDGRLVPNTELGHLQMHGRDAERLVSGAARVRRHLGWKRWAREFNVYLAMVERYFTPDLIILGGGVSKEMPRYVRYLQTRAPMVAAAMLNTSGIVGAAMAAQGGLTGAEAEAEAADRMAEHDGSALPDGAIEAHHLAPADAG